MKHLIRTCAASLALSAGLLQSCIPGETPVPVHQSGDVTTASVDMGSDYRWLVYFNLKNNAVVERKVRPSWDLGFEASPEGYHITLNNSKTMSVYRTAKTDFAAVVWGDTTGRGEKRDSPSGSMDSTAFGDWRENSPVYVVNRGSDASGSTLGFMKVQILSSDETSYRIRIAAMDGSRDQEIRVTKDGQYNFAFLSLSDGSMVSVEPPKAAWDIVFTMYTHIYYDMGNMPYTVTGCLLNHHQTRAAADSTSQFQKISYEQLSNYTFTSNIDVIGFDWKTYSFTTGSYTTKTEKNFIIHTADGVYYKLHFIDFLNASGEKGNPKWEYQRL